MTVASHAAVKNRTDLGNAERLVARHGDDLRYLHVWGKWLVWDDRRWAVDETGEVDRRAKEAVRSIWHEAAGCDDPDDRQALTKHAAASESNSRIRAMIERARAEEGVAIRITDIDTNPWLLTVKNGTIDLRTGELRGHRRDDHVTKLIDIEADTNATCPRWLAFLHRVLDGNEELLQFLQRAIGYSLTGHTTEQVLFFLHGAGSNGKSTFLEILRALLGEYAIQADFATFLERSADGPRNDVARLFGARVVTSSEVGEGRRLNESLVKTLTGGDVIAARYLYAEAFEFKPTFKLWFAANHKPVIRGTDDAIWRRIRLIPFTVQIGDAEKDIELASRLKAELPGILAWAVEGCQRWLEHGLGCPEIVKLATNTYREESDELGDFLEEHCEIRPDATVTASVLYEAYARWAGKRAVSQTMFGRQLTDRGFGIVKGRDGMRKRVGLELARHSASELTPARIVPDSSRLI
jgi:putative DNA primase/helicase